MTKYFDSDDGDEQFLKKQQKKTHLVFYQMEIILGLLTDLNQEMFNLI